MDAFPISSDLLGKSASAYEHLRRAVSRGQLRPGRRLSATSLAAAFKISETPVREALLRLATEGFLVWEASKGHFTKPTTLAEQTDLHELIAINLTDCLRRTAATELGPLASIAEAALARATPGDPDAGEQTARLLGELGTTLVARGGNQVMQSVLSIMFDRTLLVRRLDLDSPERIAQARQRISGMVGAVQSGDAGAAVAILGQHLAERRRRLPDLVEAANAAAARAPYP